MAKTDGPAAVPPITLAPDPDLVAMLERLLDEARAGQILAIGCAYHRAGHHPGTEFYVSSLGNVNALIGAAAVLQARLVKQLLA